MKRLLIVLILVCGLLLPMAAKSKKTEKKSKDPMSSATFSGLKLRGIGPAFCSGRIVDLAVNPKNPSEYYVAAAAGNVWKTVNSGTTWKPIFDKYGSWSIADVEIDPNNPNVVWIGTGEFNSQRAIGYGDGVYRSEDGGKSWKNMGLKKSERIGRIIIDPRNSHVYVAAQGPLWGPGGERGLYKSTDNGKTWKCILSISKNTGITDIVMDPRNPDVLYAASYQRRRHVFTLVNGGPESAIYKSEDAGANWTKLTSGLPVGKMGRIGLTISPACPDVIYAILEAEDGAGGFFRSSDRGASWQKQSKYTSRSGQYYSRIQADPKDVHKVYSVDVRTQVTVDGGKTFTSLSNDERHVDDHVIHIDPRDTRHLLIGGDGGLYESFDGGQKWQFKSNLPITQFYRVSLDNALPFYNVYGGTQDNNSMGGPSRTLSADGIVNDDWFITNGGDGFESQVDPKDSNIVYAQAQYGELVRYDRRSGETIGIKPIAGKGQALRWNWNSPLIISPHLHTRLYFGSNILFRSNDRGNSWTPVSGDLSRQLDRNQLKVMGKIQTPEAVAKNASTSLYGNITALSESPLKEGLLYAGTDDGLIQVTEDGGSNWRKIDKFPGVPAMTYVSFLYTSLHDVNTVYAAFDGRKNNGDFTPYLLKSTDLGKTWTPIAADLPRRGTVYCIVQDHVKPDLLFAGTEFGLYFTINGGGKWVQLKGGLPTTQVRDLAIQQRENDLVLATFGRGFYILDDYTPLRELTPKTLTGQAHLFAVKEALMFVPIRARYGQGSNYFKAPNPEFGATFTYYLKEAPKTLKQKRKKQEKAAEKSGKDIDYPTFDQLRKEDNEPSPYLLFTIKDEAGRVVRKLKKPAKSGLNRVNWDLRYPALQPVRLSRSHSSFPWQRTPRGILVLPGTYSVELALNQQGTTTPLAGPQSVKVTALANTTLPAANRAEMVKFNADVAELARAVSGAIKLNDSLLEKMKYIRAALLQTVSAPEELTAQTDALEKELKEIKRALTGDRSISKRNGNQPPSISRRLMRIAYNSGRSTSSPTGTMKEQYRIVGEEFPPLLTQLERIAQKELKALEDALEKAGAPWTPGRVPKWNTK